MGLNLIEPAIMASMKARYHFLSHSGEETRQTKGEGLSRILKREYAQRLVLFPGSLCDLRQMPEATNTKFGLWVPDCQDKSVYLTLTSFTGLAGHKVYELETAHINREMSITNTTLDLALLLNEEVLGIVTARNTSPPGDKVQVFQGLAFRYA
jgi:hypothetical protein